MLITGESGAGKEFFAQAVHLFGGTRDAPFVPVNCPQYQEGNLTVSELFGHTRGSFTGAGADRKGAFEEADGGVIFLDEIADLHASAQVMLLRALATGEFRPVGAARSRTVDVRVVSATNRPLNQLVRQNHSATTCCFRLRQFPSHPAARERGTTGAARDYWLGAVRASTASPSASRGAMRVPSGAAGNVRQLIASSRPLRDGRSSTIEPTIPSAPGSEPGRRRARTEPVRARRRSG